MKSNIDHLRVAIALQIIIVAIAISTFTERLRLTDDFFHIEKYVLARLLIETPSATAQTSDKNATDLSGNNPENYFDDLGSYEKSEKLSEVKALAAFMENAEWELFHRVPMATGGWLYYKTVLRGFTRVDQADRSDTESSGTQSAATCSTPDEENDQVFSLVLNIQEHSSMMSAPFAIKFSDAFCEINAQSLGYRWKAGEITALFPDRTELGERKSSRDLAAEALRIASRWIDNASSVDDAYARVRAKYQQGRVKLPLLESEVSAGIALTILALLAASLSTYMSFLLRRLSSTEVRSSDEGWLLIDPIRYFPKQGVARRVIASLEVACFEAFFGGAAVSAIVVGGLAVMSRGSGTAVLAWASLVIACLMAVSMASSLVRLFVIARRLRESA